MSDNGIVIASYDELWPDRAAALIDMLSATLGSTARRIEHIGSTAIPGMAAKNVLDMQISVEDLDTADNDFDEALTAIGFVRTPIERDHVPAGQRDDPGQWAKRLWARRDHLQGDVNVHVRRVGSPNERLALLFRDWMRAHPRSVAAYAAFKRALATAVPNIDVYSDIKDPVVDLVIAVAEEWAAASGWHISPTFSP